MIASGVGSGYPVRDDDFEEPLPPSREKEALAERIWNVCKHLEQAAHGTDTAWSLELALSYVANGVRSRGSVRPDRDDCNCMLRALAKAQVGSTEYLPRSYRREQITVGFEALMIVLIFWAESDQDRAQRHPDEVANALSYMKMFRNDLSNMVELEHVEHRAHARRAQTINTLWLGATQRGAA